MFSVCFLSGRWQLFIVWLLLFVFLLFLLLLLLLLESVYGIVGYTAVGGCGCGCGCCRMGGSVGWVGFWYWYGDGKVCRLLCTWESFLCIWARCVCQALMFVCFTMR